jgi:DNA repair protein RecN (Recombination protein N)
VIEELRIRGVGVIEEATLPLGPGLTVLTGETGAGKTMVLSGIGLLLGRKADPALVRTGMDRAIVEGILSIPNEDLLSTWEDLDIEDGQLIVGRSITAEGRSRAFLGGRSVPVATLAEVTAELIAVHGQSDQQRLTQPARQSDLLDTFAGADVLTQRREFSAAYDRLATISREIADLRAGGRERELEMETLARALTEIDAAQVIAGEERELDVTRARLAHVSSLRDAVAEAQDALGGTDAVDGTDVLALIDTAAKALERVRDLDTTTEPIAERLRQATREVIDILADLSHYENALDGDPTLLASLEERRSVLRGLMKRYGATTEEVLEWAESARSRVAGWSSLEDRLPQLEADAADVVQEMLGVAGSLTAARREAAQRLEKLVSVELAGLAMAGASIEVRVEPRVADAPNPLPRDIGGTGYGRGGCDAISMWLTAHAGAPARPLGAGASGGELSRIMLALEVAIAGSEPAGTLVFDEVDAGVGGRAAVEVGRRLARLARSTQVLVVTHLPQVAAFADRHLVVEKAASGKVTSTTVRVVEGDDRRREIARMLAGLEDSEAATTHAEELLQLARENDTPETPRKRAQRSTRIA